MSLGWVLHGAMGAMGNSAALPGAMGSYGPYVIWPELWLQSFFADACTRVWEQGKGLIPLQTHEVRCVCRTVYTHVEQSYTCDI
jgi:hypothetical protein